MNIELWRDRITNRADLVARITHLTRGDNDDHAFEMLWKILLDKKLIGSGKNGFVVGGNRAVCFQEVPLYSIVENLLFEDTLKDNNRYSWFGLRFNKVRMYEKGARPVLYGKTEELKRILPPSDYWRIVHLDLEERNVIDWSHEREWRILGDYNFLYDDVEVVVRNDIYYRKLVDRCIDENKLDILREIHGIVPLNTVIS